VLRVRFDAKPYPGEPIPLHDLVETGLYMEGGKVVWDRGEGEPPIPAEMPLGYDFACPDWRERLGRAMDRAFDLQSDAEELVEKGPMDRREFEMGYAEGVTDVRAILREEFGLEESGAEPAPVPAPLIAAVEWALAWASCTPCPSIADGMIRVGRALGASHPRVCIAEVELLAQARVPELEAAVRAILAKADASPAQDAHSTPVTAP